uniref:Piwi domain-containing protein n=1 Tax=Panagrellus redivivus TaxID=6233 RepID=A0A7E4VUG7_PANRE
MADSHNRPPGRRHQNQGNQGLPNRGRFTNQGYGAGFENSNRPPRGQTQQNRGYGGGFGNALSMTSPAFGEGMIFPLEIKPGSKAYRKHVDIVFNFTKDGRYICVNITDKRHGTRKRLLCYQIMATVSTMVEAFKGVEYVYDNMHNMYTSKKIDDFTYTIKDNDIPAEMLKCLGPHEGELVMTVREADSVQVVDLCDLSQYKTDTVLLREDRALRNALEMIVTESALATGHFLVARGNDLFRVEEEPIDRGLCTRLGTKKGIRIIKKDGEYLPALVVDTVHSPFYATEAKTNFLDFVLSFIGNPRTANWEEAKTFLNGIKVYPEYGQHRVLQFDDFTVETVANLIVTRDDGATMPMKEYFQAFTNTTLKRLNLPAMIAKNNAGIYPMEVLCVVPSQLVDLDVCPNNMRDKVHRRNAVAPRIRHDEIMQELKAMDINGAIGRAFGIDPNAPIENVSHLTFEQPPKPKIQLGSGRIITPFEDGKFKLSGPYLNPAVIDNMAVLVTDGLQSLAKEFLKRFIENGQFSGMRFPAFNSIYWQTICDGSSFENWDKTFEYFKNHNISFVLMIGNNRDPNSHNFLKLCESRHKILTQLVMSETADRIVSRGQHVTLSNILHKTNIKNGGLNYKPLFDKVGERLDINIGKVLIFAYDVSHPGELDSALPQNRKEVKTVGEFPSVVGLVANVLPEPSAFADSFFYQQSRKEEVVSSVFGDHVKKMLMLLVKSGRSLPSTVAILRDGVSEGQFSMVVHKELPLIKQACAEVKPTWKPKFLVAIVTKRHHKRFVNEDLTNASVGSFVTDKVVRPDCVEFFMACHKTIKGTTKFVQVSIIHNEPKATMEELKQFLHALSYGHQIVTSPASLPTPVYQADDVATRGREVLYTLRRERPNEIPMTEDGAVDFEALSSFLGYFDSPLAAKRCSA